ncbi:MAG: SOS response-associated peptidase family protein, partial [Pseudonocardiaceae bacterium]
TGEEALLTCAVITTPANSVVAPVHDRMPALLDPVSVDQWLNPAQTNITALAALLIPAGPETLTRREVDPRVNNVVNDFAELVAYSD